MRTDQQPRLQDVDADGWLIDVARIFAEGVLRLHKLGHLPFGCDGLSLETALKTAPQDLDSSRDPRLSVTRG